MNKIQKFIGCLTIIMLLGINFSYAINTVTNEIVNNSIENNTVINNVDNTAENNIVTNNTITNSIENTKIDETNTIQNNVVEQENRSTYTPKSTEVQEGIYKIRVAKSKEYILDISAASKDNAANLQIWQDTNELQQRFKLQKTQDGYYIIKNMNSGKVLDVEWAGTLPGTNVRQWEQNNTDAQKWAIEETQDGYYNMISKLSGLAIAIQSTAKNGTNIIIDSVDKNDAVKFDLEKIETVKGTKIIDEERYIIRSNLDNNKVIDVEAASKDSSANIHVWSEAGVLQQKFKFIYDGNGYYTIQSVNSGKVLDVAGASLMSGTNVWQYDSNGTDAQKWAIKEKTKGVYTIQSKLNNLFLTIDDINNGSNVRVKLEDTESSKQEFILESIEVKGTKVIEEGTYRIASGIDENKTLDISAASKDNKANVQTWSYVGESQQKFEFKYDGNGYYTIINKNSGKVLDVADGSLKSGANVWQYESNGTDAQKWAIKETDDGYYNIISKLSGMYLNITSSDSKNGININVVTANKQTSQKFKLINKDVFKGGKTIEEGTYKIVMAKNNNVSLDISGALTTSGTNVQVWNYTGEEQQQFNISYDGNGYYNIISVKSGKVIDISNGSNKINSNVQQWENNETNAQKWAIKKNEDGSYSIVSKVDSMYLDVEDGKTSNGTNVRIREENVSDSQKFNLIKITNKAERTISDGTYRIAVASDETFGIDIDAASKENGANAQIWKYVRELQQMFKIKYTDDGFYIIQNINSDKFLCVQNGTMQKGTNVWQYSNNESEAQRWIIRNVGNGKINILPKENLNLAIDIDCNNVANGTNIKLYSKSYNTAQQFRFLEANSGVDIDSSKYPGIKELVAQIVKEYPTWEFEILYTGLDFYSAISSEYYLENRTGNLVYTPTYNGAWIAPNPQVDTSGTWASASEQAVAYFMDPRNFLNTNDVFQFVDLGNYSASGATRDSIQYQINGTYLNEYADDINNACRETNINPYYIVARLIQEQGAKGGSTINMDGGDGKRYYNPFNIGATGNSPEEVTRNALQRAKAEGWDTMQKGLVGGIRKIKSWYIDKCQNTLYLNKFDVNPASEGDPYDHQYQQNISAPLTEGRTMRKAYNSTGTLNNKIKFIIPVYENMPTEPATKPTGSQTSDIGPKNIEIININDVGLKLREQPSSSSNNINGITFKNGDKLLSVERLSGWTKVVTNDNVVGYIANEYNNVPYWKYINDITNCNEKVSTTANVYLRSGPGTTFPSLGLYTKGTTGIRINKGTYSTSTYDWDEVILDDGSKGFIASKYLQIK